MEVHRRSIVFSSMCKQVEMGGCKVQRTVLFLESLPCNYVLNAMTRKASKGWLLARLSVLDLAPSHSQALQIVWSLIPMPTFWTVYFVAVRIWYPCYTQLPLIFERFCEDDISLQRIKNNVDKSPRKPRWRCWNTTTRYYDFGEADHKFYKHNTQRK